MVVRAVGYWSIVLALALPACGRVFDEAASSDGGRGDDSFVALDGVAADVEREDDGEDPAPTDSTATDTVSRADAVAPPPSGPRCNNGIDDDGDGLIDGVDPECTTPFDNDEASFAKGVTGDGEDGDWGWCKLDCAFDGNGGSGDDGCTFDGRCHRLPNDPRCPFDPIAAADPVKCPPQPTRCTNYCGPRTPNGCDYTGCCDVFDSSGVAHRVRLNPTCSMATLSDPTRCWPCERNEEYARPCGRCDACIGKSKVPSDCGTTCGNGASRCGPGAPCAAGEWCLTGCCIPTGL